jgi:hypothetical protein
VSGQVNGTLVKTVSMTFNLVAQAPAGTLVGGVPVIFLPTTAGNESFACSPVTAVLTATCTGSLVGDLLQGATVTVRLPHTTLGVVEVTGSHVAPAPPASQVGILVVPPLMPAPGSAPALVPLAPPPLIPPLGPPRPGGTPSFPEVPVIPEADTSTMLLAGLLTVAALIGIRPRHG